jgi:hypothetical protein
MRSLLPVALLLLAAPFAALPARADCQVVTVEQYPDVNYTTACLLEQQTYGDPSQTFSDDYVVHVSHAVEADPVFDDAHADVAQTGWSYDDGTTQQQRQQTDVGAGAFEGATGLVGTGFQADANQRDQTTSEDGGNGCSWAIGHSTCVGASGWLTVQDVASVGVGAYDSQTGSGSGCQETREVDVDAAVVFVPVTTGPSPCAAELPSLYDAVPFRDLPTLP